LNNDAVVESSCLDLLVKAASDSPETGLLSPHIVSMTNAAPALVRGWLVLAVVRDSGSGAERGRTSRGPGSPREVDYATGCAMLIRPAVVRSVGSLDARLFAYCEDLDFSLRARNAGFGVLVVPRARVHHAAADSDRLSQSIYYSTRNLLEVMRRHGTWYHWNWDRAEFPRALGGLLYRARVPAGPARVPPGPRPRSGRLCEGPARGAEPEAGSGRGAEPRLPE
jgi:GT2 family glycosyltransferase